MAFNASTAGPYFVGSGPISFSDIRDRFRAQNSDQTFNVDNDPISISTLYRNTSTALADPLMPDCDVNETQLVPTSGTYRFSDFRNTIKYTYITQTGTELNVDIDALAWGSDLNRNIKKFFVINGTIGSNSVTAPAATYNANSVNLDIEVRGEVYGAGGAGGLKTGPVPATAGGTALTVDSPTGSNNRIVVFAGGELFGGGGGGAPGADGTVSFRVNYTNGGAQRSSIIWNGQQFVTVCGSAQASCDATKRSGPGISNVTVSCTGNFSPPACACDRCDGSYTQTNATTGGDGGPGRGFSYQTGSLAGGPSTGGSAVAGGTGGDWGQAGGPGGTGGAAGSAATGGTNFTMAGTINTNTVKGSTF